MDKEWYNNYRARLMSTEVKHTQVEIIEYEYPDLGRVEITLQAESAEIYRFFKEGWFIKARKGMGIEHFERLDQLGALRAVYKTAHHSRWEYMVLQMYLIQQLKAASAFGFSTSIPLTRHHRVSSLEELLKSWVLLNNFGHLLDTFEAERVWLELILEEPELYKAFISCMPDGISTKLAEEILKEEAMYRFHHSVALALLGRLSKKKGKSKRPFDLWIEMIKALLRKDAEEGSKLGRGLSIFNVLRRVSYVLLDINRSALFLRIDSNNLLRNISKKPDDLLYNPESDVNKTLENIERLLFSEIYASEQACTFKHHYIKGQKEEFYKSVSKIGIGVYCKDYKAFAGRLQGAKVDNFGKYEPNPKTKHICRLNLLPSSWFERSVCRFYTEQKKLHSKANDNIEFLVTPTSYLEAGSIVDVFATSKLNAQELSALYYTLAEYVIECYSEWAPDEELPGYAMSDPLQELFSQILAAFIDGKLRLRFPMGVSPRDYHVDIIPNKPSRANWTRSFLYDIGEAKLAPAREWELRALLQLLRRQKGELFLTAISNIHLYNPDGTREVEWDGVFFNIKKDDIILYIVEAKRNESKKSQKCSNALLESIHKAGIRRKQGNFSTVRYKGYAYTKIALTDITLPTLL